jgi:tRNA/rRNA methyltransferase
VRKKIKNSGDDLNLNSNVNNGLQGDLNLDVRIILVEPAGALNLGSVARVLKNMGLTQLWLVNPQCDRHSEDAQQMAVHAKDILDAAQIVDSLPAALVGCQRAIATVGRIDFTDEMLTEAQDAITGLQWLIAAPSSAIVFGPEDRGLSNREIAYCQQILTIPTSEAYASLNLAQAVGICCYQLRQLAIAAKAQTPAINKNKVDQNSTAINNPNLPVVGQQSNSDKFSAQTWTGQNQEIATEHNIKPEQSSTVAVTEDIRSDASSDRPQQVPIDRHTSAQLNQANPTNPDLPDREKANAKKFAIKTSQIDKDLLDSASIDAIEAYYQQLETVLLQIGFLYPHTAFSRMKKLRRIFNKATLTESEVTMLRGMLSQIAWAVSQSDHNT